MILYGLFFLFTCLFFDYRVVLTGIVVFQIFSGHVEEFFKTPAQEAVAIGKYISKDVTPHTDGPEDVLSQPTPIVEQSVNEPLVCESWPRFDQQSQWSDRSKVLEGVESPRKESVRVHHPEKVVKKVRFHPDVVTSTFPTKIEPITSKGPTWHRASLEKPATLADLKAIEEPTNGWPSTGVENIKALQTTPLTLASPIDGHPPTKAASAVEKGEHEQSPRAALQLEAILTPQRLRENEVRSKRGSTPTRVSKPQRIVRTKVARFRLQCGRAGRMVDSNAEADGRMIGVEGDDSMVGVEVNDLMVCVVYSKQDTASLEVGEPMDLCPDDVDEPAQVMAGLNMDGMELDRE